MDRTLISNMREMSGEVRYSKLMGEWSGPVLIIGAGKVTGRFIVGDWKW